MAGKARFAGKSMVVTGAAQGIGRQVALEAAAGGARLALVDRSPLVQDVARAINSEYGQGQSIAIEADLETWSGNEEAMARADRTFGAIDILVANVGGAIWMKPFEKFDEKQLIAEINRSLYPTMWACRAVLPYMIEQGRGAIVNVSSVATKGVNRVPYSAAKGAVNALTASLAIEVGTKNIRVNAVAPGGTTAPPRAVPRRRATILIPSIRTRVPIGIARARSFRGSPSRRQLPIVCKSGDARVFPLLRREACGARSLDSRSARSRRALRRLTAR